MTGRMTLLPALALVLFIGSAMPAADPPTEGDLASLPAGDTVSEAAKKTIEAYVKHWLGVLVGAKDTVTLANARKKLLLGNAVLPSDSYRYEYAKSYARHVSPALTLRGDPLGIAKETNAAMVAARLQDLQPTIEPALAQMAVHRNPAVRYWAAKGYRGVGRWLLIQDTSARKMLAVLEKMGLAEKSGPVVAAVLHAASGYPGAGGANVAKLRLVLAKVWLARCRELYEANPEMIAAFQRAAGHLTRATKADEKTALQVLIDAMEAAALALDKAEENDEEDVCATLGEFLRGMEERVETITGRAGRPIATALKSREGWDVKAPTIVLAVNGLKDWLLKNRVIKTRFKPPAPPVAKTQPTTKPAG